LGLGLIVDSGPLIGSGASFFESVILEYPKVPKYLNHLVVLEEKFNTGRYSALCLDDTMPQLY